MEAKQNEVTGINFDEIELPDLGKCADCGLELGGEAMGRVFILGPGDDLREGDIAICRECGREHLYRGGAITAAGQDEIATAVEAAGGDMASMFRCARLAIQWGIKKRKLVLNAAAVDELVIYCIRRDDEPQVDSDVAVIDGVSAMWHFDRRRVAESEVQIVTLLSELPDEFRVGCGGGLSIRRGKFDKMGNEWASCLWPVEGLFCVGIAAGHARWLGDSDTWSAMPGGVPYVSIF